MAGPRLGDAALLGLIAACLCPLFFAGFGLGDDAAYAAMVSGLDAYGYPPVKDWNVFAGRPLLLFLISRSLIVFGHREWAFVLPVMVAAVLAVVSAYYIAALLATRRAGWLAAGALALSPMQLAYATTLCNDILGAGLLGTGAALVLAAARVRRSALRVFVAGVGGMIAGSSLGVKSSFALLALPLLCLLAIGLVKGWERKPLLAGLAGYGLAAAALLAFFWIVAGNPFAGPLVELTFNRIHMLPQASHLPLSDVLLFYPRIASGTQAWGPAPIAWSPAGLFFPLAAVALCDALIRRERASRFVALAFVGMGVMLEFWPLQMSPAYVPIHRLPRFLYPLLVPGAVLIGIAASQWFDRGRAVRALLGFTALIYVASSLSIAARAVAFHNDCMNDIRFSANLALQASGFVLVDSEIEPYLRFRAGQDASTARVLPLMRGTSRAPAGSMVFVGGSRRPELDPAFAQSTVPASTPSGWIKVADMPGTVQPWRLVRGAVYVVAANSTPAMEMASACPAGRRWTLQDVVDVGNRESERQHGFSIEGQTWSGSRSFGFGDAAVWDDGRAFTGDEAFDVTVRERAADVCIVKRLDSAVALQASRWDVNDRPVAVIHADRNVAGQWGVVSFVIPGERIESGTLRLREHFVGSTLDVNAFRVEIYQ